MENQLRINTTSKIFLGLALAGLCGIVLSFFQDKSVLAHSYLTALVFVLSIPLGALFFVLIQHLTRAGWSVTVRRLAEQVMLPLRWIWILFLPLAFFALHTLYHWTHQDAVAHDKILQAKQAYLNIPFFSIRALVFFAGWALFANYFFRQSVAQDTDGLKSRTLSMQKVATIGAIFYALSETFFAFDWMMSLTPHWFSTIYGLYFFAAQTVSVLSVLILLVLLLHSQGHLKKEITIEHLHDLGKLLFGFNVFWTYIAYSQWMLIWYANLGEETPFYLARMVGNWKTVSITLVIVHFVIPFFLLLSRNGKRNPFILGLSALIILLSSYFDMYWLIMPNVYKENAVFGLSDISSFLFAFGLLGFFILRSIPKAALYPLKDPRLTESLHHSN